jgi:hypothetical protein
MQCLRETQKIRPYIYAVCPRCSLFKRLNYGGKIFEGLLATNASEKYEI